MESCPSWSKEHDWKSCKSLKRLRGFESLALRHSIRVFKRLKALVFLSENIRFLPSRRRFADGRVCLFMGVWRQVAASGSEKVPISLRLRWAIKLQDIVWRSDCLKKVFSFIGFVAIIV